MDTAEGAPAEVEIDDARKQLTTLAERAAKGEEISIVRSGKPLCRLAPLEAEPDARPVLNRWKGRIWMSDDFDDPMPEFAEYV